MSFDVWEEGIVLNHHLPKDRGVLSKEADRALRRKGGGQKVHLTMFTVPAAVWPAIGVP